MMIYKMLLLFLNIYFVKFKLAVVAYDIDYTGWTKRVQTESPRYEVQIHNPLESSYENEVEITLTDEAKKIYKKYESNFKIQFNVTLFVTTSRKTEVQLQICDKEQNVPEIENKKFITFEMTKELLKSDRCQEEFKFKIKTEESNQPPNKYDPAETDLLFSLTNFSFIITHQDQVLPILLNDTNNFIFKIDNKQIEDYSKFYLNEHFPLFSHEIDEFWFVNNFHEIIVHEMNFDEMLKQTSNGSRMDYCFNFRYYNIDNTISLKMTAVDTDFQLNLIDLDSTYWESNLTSYSWFKIKDLCILQYFARPPLFPASVQFKLVSTNFRNSGSNLFALYRMQAYSTPTLVSDSDAYFLSWNRTAGDARTQWAPIPLVPNNYFIFDKFNKNIDYRLKLTSKSQSRLRKYILYSKLIEYQSNGVLNFEMDNKIDQLDFKIEWFDHMNTLLKVNQFKLVSTNETRHFAIELTESDSHNFSSKMNKLYRIVMTFVLPNDPTIFTAKNKTDSSFKEKSLIISKLTYLDPCKAGSCLNNGECVGLNVKNFKCICDESWSGEHCEYVNRCSNPINETTDLTGKQYCGQFGENVKCRAVNNGFECKCLNDSYWNAETKACNEYDGCTFKICGLNEKCTVNRNGIALCECRERYTFNVTAGRCESLLCDNINVCSITEDCINVAGVTDSTCVCKIGFVRMSNTCKKLEDNPFVVQELGCAHRYGIIKKNDTVFCTCFPGYVLQSDGKNCKKSKDFVADEQCEKCDLNRQICIKGSNGKIECVCKNGYYGTNCGNHFCEQTDNDDPKLICGDLGCRLNTRIEGDYRFECKCDPKFSELNVTTGKCEIKDPCVEDQSKCDTLNGNCVPAIIMVKQDKELSHRCICKNNEMKNSFGVCSDRCGGQCFIDLRNVCELDLLNNTGECRCNRGFVFSEQDNACVVVTDALNFTLNMVLRSTNSMAEENLPENDFISVCDLLTDPRNCILKYDALYRQLNYDVIDKKAIDKFIESQIAVQLRNGFDKIITERPYEIWVTSYRNLTEINYKQWGFKTNFSVDVTIASRFDEMNGIPLADHVSLERIKQVCYPNKLSSKRKREIEMIRSKSFRFDSNQIDTIDCIIEPELILYNLKTIQPIKENICEIEDAIKCPVYSACEQVSKGVSFKYKCSCGSGFSDSDIAVTDAKLEVPVMCEDHDECKDERYMNNCNLNTTTCENTPGSYKCNCIDDFKRISRFACDEACGQNMSVKCVNGDCVIIDKHFERCICKDGWKNDDCSVEVEKVRLLKKMLFITTIGLCVVIMFLSLIACYFYAKRSNEVLEDIDKSERSDKSDPNLPKKDEKFNSYSNQMFDDNKVVPMSSNELKDDAENVNSKN